MEMVIHNIRDLAGNHRTAAEQLVGHKLRENQQLVIHVVTPDHESLPEQATDEPKLPAWCNVYEGMTDAEIDEIEKSIVRNHSSRGAS